jgi:hypothetical protein
VEQRGNRNTNKLLSRERGNKDNNELWSIENIGTRISCREGKRTKIRGRAERE